MIKGVRQSTGYKDITGRVIMEGDLVEHYQAPVNLVILNKGQWCLDNYHAGALPFESQDMAKAKVIGNVYDNPGLYPGDPDVS